MSTINDKVYIAGDFSDPVKYAKHINELLGDLFSHATTRMSFSLTGAISLGTGSKTFTPVDLGGNVPYEIVGSAVRVIAVHDFSSWMIGIVTAISSSSITINVLAYATNTLIADTAWSLQYVGMARAMPGGTITQALGGLGVTTALGARTALGLGDPAVLSEGIFDDFISGPSLHSDSIVVPERWNLGNNSATAVYVPNACLTYAGYKGRMDNSVAVIPSGTPPIYLGTGTFANHPGVCALEITTAQDLFNMQYGATTARGFCFPASGDVMEVMFQVPIAYDAGDLVEIDIGMLGSGVNIFLKLYSDLNGAATPNYSGVLEGLGTGAVPFSSALSAQLTSGVWYRMFLYGSSGTVATVNIYTEAGTLVATAAATHGITQSSGNEMRPTIEFAKSAGSKKLALLIDYCYIKKAVTR